MIAIAARHASTIEICVNGAICGFFIIDVLTF